MHKIPSLDTLPDSAFIREAQLVQSPKRPDATAVLPFSAPTLWRKVKAGTFPKPHRLSDRVTAWKVGDVRAWINAHTTDDQGANDAKCR
ncbi:helix-turn-helix transcriptional regulator [Acidovorax sp.]|jgi:predicted DNA-binding transcriptional regulator AlpA|uniref:helix-turn-helix transcriptional regulator n=1 Tax=Acidovorax sp. TaxID=1872122 RepID=UPI004037A504